MLLIFLSIFLVSVIIDTFTRLRFCKNVDIKLISILLTHRFVYIFMYFGWIFNNKIILILYILSLISVHLYWYFNNNICDVTRIENDLCEYEEYKYFDYLYIFFDTKTADIILKSLLVVFISISVIKILNWIKNYL